MATQSPSFKQWDWIAASPYGLLAMTVGGSGILSSGRWHNLSGTEKGTPYGFKH
ncbi:MAG: hypothetical protein PHW63_08575 [Alphaproteobacteria bacterium]|nr:hypothetical protein [Alphaproteobacteria bacterium]